MKRFIVTALALAMTGSWSAVSASGPDKRLATVRKAFVVPVDDLGDDVAVAKCVASHLGEVTPIEAVKAKPDAELVFRIAAHLPSQTARHLMGSMGGRPSADLFVETPDGEKIWHDGAKLGSGWTRDKGTSIQDNQTTACAIADELLDTLRTAMRKARDSR